MSLLPHNTQTGLWANVIGQERAIAFLKKSVTRPSHAYLFVGAPGVGAKEAAIAFAAAILSSEATDDVVAADVTRRVLEGVHPDVLLVERVGASILRDQIAEVVIPAAMRTPLEANKKVLILDEVHLLEDAARAALLKTVEEPPAGTIFVLLAEQTPNELETLVSRSVVVEFPPLPDALIVRALEEIDVPTSQAREIASAAGGRLDRAKQLATDPNFAARQEIWRSVPRVLDSTGATVADCVDRMIIALDVATDPIKARHKEENSEIAKLVKAQGSERGFRLKEVEKRQKREIRRARVDELKAGLATLSIVYRDRLLSDPSGSTASAQLAALDAISKTVEALRYNPSEKLLLWALLLRLEQAAVA